MSDTDPSLDPIFAYLREYSARYSFTALREQLLQNGYEPAEVDRAIAVFQQQKKPPRSTVRTVLRVLGGILLAGLIAIALIILVVGGFCILITYATS